MDKKITLKRWAADTTGVSVTAQGISIHAELYGRKSNGILLYNKENPEPVRIDFTEEMRQGSVYRCMLSGVSPQAYDYLFHEDGQPVMDLYAKRLTGHRLFGEKHREAGKKDALRACSLVSEQFDWRGDKRPGTSYEDSVYYGMHVRGFTKDASSRIKEAGTFAGVQKKIPYLKKLGVTGVVLQPVYEFEECIKKPENRTVADVSAQFQEASAAKINYWGYLSGYYMAPKNAYAYSEDAVTELKTLVRQLHKNDLEIILQFYFEPSMPAARIRNILLYWAEHYHIDGFELMGAALPLKEIAMEPGLSDVKLWSAWFPWEEIADAKKDRNLLRIPEQYKKRGQLRVEEKEERKLASFGRYYQDTVRCFLKGDGGMLPAFLQCQREHPGDHSQINFLASYNTLRLADVVSYERKHNEANGEDNRDGEEINHSWNCGMEGSTKKKNILALRMKLMKNALVMLFTAQGTPFLFMGDEWGKSSEGNNNPWCQDNEMTWQKWNLKKTEKQLLAFTGELIALRKAHGVMHQREPLKLMDYLSCGCPDLSYHGKEAWRTSMDYQMRHIGVMLCGKYCTVNGKEDDCLYIAYNMHWESHEFALPKLFKNRRWKLFLCTDGDASQENPTQEGVSPDSAAQSVVTLPARSVTIYISEEAPKAQAGRRRN